MYSHLYNEMLNYTYSAFSFLSSSIFVKPKRISATVASERV